MVMPTWLLGIGSVATESSAGIRAILRSARERPRLYGEGVTGGGLARIRPVPGSSGSVLCTGGGVGLGALSPGKREMLVVSLRYQLLFGPGRTSGGFEYQRFAGTPVNAMLTKVCTPGDAT